MAKKTNTKAAEAETETKTEAKAPEIDERDRIAHEITEQMKALAERFDFDVSRKTEHGEVPVAELLNIDGLDSRASTGMLDPIFLKSLKNDDGSPHLIEPVIAAWAKDKQNGGKIVRVLVAGRKRTAGFAEHGFATIEAITKTYTLQQVLIDAGIENRRRQGMSAWDTAVYYMRLKAAGLNQSEIATRDGVANSTVTQTLSLLTLDKRVRELMKKGKFGPGAATIGRELAKVDDLDQQYAIAMKVIEDPNNIWTGNEVQAYVKELNDRATAAAKRKAEKAKEKKRLAKEAKARGEEAGDGDDEGNDEGDEEPEYQFDVEAFDPIEVKPLHLRMEQIFAQAAKVKEDEPEIVAKIKALKTKHESELKYVEAQGHLRGLKEAAGLAKLPKAIEVAAAEE